MAIVQIKSDVREEVVEFLERALERARAGETIGVAIVEVSKGREVAIDHVGESYHLINSGAARLAARLAIS
jgi:hypothetical protein